MEKFIVPCRFDLMAKYLYVWARDKKISSLFFKELYHKHVETFNGCYEKPDHTIGDGLVHKKNIDDFFKAFNILIEDMKKNGYDKNYPIPMGNNGVICNGSHRLIVSYYYNIEPILKYYGNGNCIYNYKFFINRNDKSLSNLKQIYADTMALEYINHNNNLRTMIVWPIAYNKLEEKNSEFKKIIDEYGTIYYDKTVHLSKKGVSNLIEECYRGEEWIGGMFPNGSKGSNAKLEFCYQDAPTVCFLFCINDVEKLLEMKEKCRQLFGIGKHSVHTSDYYQDTFRITSSLLNKNSVQFLNNFKGIQSNTRNLLINYFNTIEKEKNDYCLTSSLILEMYGLRNAKDVDYLHKYDYQISNPNIGLHIGIWLSYYHENKDEIIYNPNYHFYFNGYKFATLDVIKRMKENRLEEKDKVDIKLINDSNIL